MLTPKRSIVLIAFVAMLAAGVATHVLSRPSASQRAHEHVASITLEEYLRSCYGERWERARAQLLDESMVSEALLASSIDATSILPWPDVRARLAADAEAPIDVERVRSRLIDWKPMNVDANLARMGLDVGDKALRDDERAAIEAIAARYAEPMGSLAEVAGDELAALARRSWAEDEVLRTPVLSTTPPAPNGPPPHAKPRPHERLSYRTSITIEGWNVLVAADVERSQLLNDVLDELGDQAAQRRRAIEEFLRTRG